MSTATLPDLHFDVDSLIDSAFEELRCDHPLDDHEGKVTGYTIAHDCPAGYVCERHFKYMVETVLPKHHAKLAARGFLRCTKCKKIFTDVPSFVKVIGL